MLVFVLRLNQDAVRAAFVGKKEHSAVMHPRHYELEAAAVAAARLGARALERQAAWRRLALRICLVVVLQVAASRGLQFVSESFARRLDVSVQAQPIDERRCPLLDEHVWRAMTIDELNDLQQQACPRLVARR